MKYKIFRFALCLLFIATNSMSQEENHSSSGKSLTEAEKSIQHKLDESVEELNQLREQEAAEKLPLSQKLNELESEMLSVRDEYQAKMRMLDSHTLDLSNFRNEIKLRQEEASYLTNLLQEYIRNFESRLHISEINRYKTEIETAKLASENSNLDEQEVYEAQAALLMVALNRLEDALGGTRFIGTAVDSSGVVKKGTFVLIGPASFFRSDDGTVVGTAEQRLGSLEPTIYAFDNPMDTQAVADLIEKRSGNIPLDVTLGNAHKIEATKEKLIDHIKKGGPVMIPIFILAAVSLIVAFFKWLGMAFVRTPSRKQIRELLEAVSRRNRKVALHKAKAMRGPVGRMLASGIEHIKDPRELIEEVMYETLLATRLKLERFLPFISISAASAPLLGLLGTVTGIINTFKLITVFGSGDVKTLSGGISEALITTEFGLIVAIPSLLIHAFLTRKARGIVNQMEKAAVGLVNQISKTPYMKDNELSVISLDSDIHNMRNDNNHRNLREQVIEKPVQPQSPEIG